MFSELSWKQLFSNTCHLVKCRAGVSEVGKSDRMSGNRPLVKLLAHSSQRVTEVRRLRTATVGDYAATST